MSMVNCRYKPVDVMQVIVTETRVRICSSIKRSEGTECLPNATIFEQLTLMGWFKPLKELAEVPKIPTDPQHTPTIIQPSTSQPQKKQPRRKQRKDIEVPKLWSIQILPDEAPMRSIKLMKDLGAQEDATKQGRKIAELGCDYRCLLSKYLKPKPVTTAATTTTNSVTRPKARGVVVQEPSEFKTTTPSLQTSQLPHAKDKGKAKMIEPEKPLKKKDQILIDEKNA
ncbi:hypothetical protein Tco_1458722 [Tanacetum coccineum]